MKRLILIVLAGFAFIARAGDSKRNGGDVLQCTKNNQIIYQTLDLREGLELYGFTYPSFQTSADFMQILNLLFSKIQDFNPRRAKMYSDFLQNFEKESRLVPQSSFTDLPDEGGKLVPENCLLQQAVLQLRTPDFYGKRYQINQEIWQHLDAFNKAALVLHEFIYRELSTDNKMTKDSASVRYFNSFLFSSQFAATTLLDYFNVLQGSGLKTADAHGYPIILNSGDQYAPDIRFYPVTFYDKHNLASARVGHNFKINDSNISTITCHPRDLGSPQEIHIQLSPTYHEATIWSDCLMYLPLDNAYVRGGALVDTLYLPQPGQLEKAILRNWEGPDKIGEPSLNLQGADFSLIKKGETTIRFWPNGDLKLIKRWQRSDERQASYILRNNRQITFDELKIDRACFVNSAMLEKCNDPSEDWFKIKHPEISKF